MNRTTSLVVTSLSVVMLLLPAGGAYSAIIISEIMYNPDSSESGPSDVEWIEIYNNGGSSANITGYYIDDFPDGTTAVLPTASLAAGEAAVIIPEEQTIADFQAAWGSGYQIFPVGGWIFGSTTGKDGGNIGGLSNGPSATNEILRLYDASDVQLDLVNFDDSSPWPSDSPDGPSIYMVPLSISSPGAGNIGSNWASSSAGTHGAINNTVTGDFGGVDTGSPGTVVVPEPTSVALLLIGAVGFGLTRRRFW